MSYMQREQEDLFSFFELGEIPTEKDPFCNSTENTAYRESYSDVIPAFFFRDTKCSKKPTKAERKKLRYYYNSTGVILLAKLIIEISACLMFYVLLILSAVSFTPSVNLFYSALSDDTVRYAFRTIAAVISTASVFFAGCRFTGLSPAKVVKSCPVISTGDVIICFMTGMFFAGLSNLMSFSVPSACGGYMPSAMHLEKNWMTAAITALFVCVIVPVTDGLVFRGLVLKNLSRASQRFGIIMSAVLCALATCSLPAMIPAFLTSVLLGSMTVKHNSAVPSVLIHMAVNTSSMIISVYSTFAWGSGETIIKVWTMITLVIGGVFTAVRIAKDPLPKNKPEQRRRSLPVALSSVFVVLLFPVYVFTSLVGLLYFMYL